MYLEKISLSQFKNYEFETISFPSRITFITGENGSGKTNLLDAIYFCCLTKGAFTFQDKLLIMHKVDYFSIVAKISSGQEYEINCGYIKRSGKYFKINKLEYERISKHVGRFPAIMISPYDTEIIREGSETKRKFIDTFICQLDPEYLHSLQKYNHYLKQRNRALKMWADGKLKDKEFIKIYDDPIISFSKSIFKIRNSILKELKDKFNLVFRVLSREKEEVSLDYKSQASDDRFEENFHNSFEKDLILHRTNVGIHRDSLIFEIGGLPIKGFGSQGQQKTFITSLKLAQYFILAKYKEVKPLLLLDDIFDKLDDERINVLLKFISSDQFGQVFITDARKERLYNIAERIKDSEVIEIESGKMKDNN